MTTEMENGIFDRTRRLVGKEGMERISSASVIVFGVGGVGSWCAEGLIRSGIHHLTIVDSDCVSVTNINRQLMATTKTVGRPKVEALRERLLEINPDAEITAIQGIYSAETADNYDLDSFDYVVDAIDSLKDKILLVLNASASKAKLFCALGAALKLDPTQIKVAEFWKVRDCPLGAMMRKRMRQNGTFPKKKFKCVYDGEVLPNRGEIDTDLMSGTWDKGKAQINGSTVHITGIFGLTLAGLVIQDLCK